MPSQCLPRAGSVPADNPQLRPALLSLRIATCHLPGSSSKAVCVEQRLVKLPPLICCHFAQRRVCDDLRDAAAQSALAIGGWPMSRILL